MQEEKFICSICGKEFTVQEYKRPKTALSKHLPFCKWRKDVLDYFNVERSELENLLSKYGSVQNILRNLPDYLQISSWIYKLFKEDNIETSIKKANNSEAVKKLREETNLERYGSRHNFCKDHPSRKQWEERLLTEEGITNVFQRESVKRKAKETMLEKYGVEYAAQSELFLVTEEYMINKYGEEQGKKAWKELCYNRGKSNRLSYYVDKYGEEEGRKKYSERIANIQTHYTNKNNKISSLNIKFRELLNSLSIQYEEEFCLWLDDIHPKYYDFKIGNSIIELNGDFWHANPNKYKADDIINFPGQSYTAAQVWERDEIKRELALTNGYRIYYFWESQINDKDYWDKIVNKFTEYANSKNKKH